MTNVEAIETLTTLGYFIRSVAHFYEKTNPGKISTMWKDIAAIDVAIAALEKNEGKVVGR